MGKKLPKEVQLNTLNPFKKKEEEPKTALTSIKVSVGNAAGKAKGAVSGVKDSAEATKELKKIDSKLNGIIESRGPTPLTVSGQVQALIAEATDINNLSQMYIWWMPWC